MAFFPVLFAPLWYWLVTSLYREPARGLRGLTLPFVGGLLVAVPALAATWTMGLRTSFGTGLGHLLPWAWYRGPGWAGTLLAVVLLLLGFLRDSRTSRVREYAGWCAGLMAAYGLFYGVSPEPGFEISRALLMPLDWMAMASLVSWTAGRFATDTAPRRYVWAALAAILPTVLTAVPILDAAGYHLAAWLSAIAVLASGFSLVLLDSRGRAR